MLSFKEQFSFSWEGENMATLESPIKFSTYPFGWKQTTNWNTVEEKEGKNWETPELFLSLLKEPTTQTKRLSLEMTYG